MCVVAEYIHERLYAIPAVLVRATGLGIGLAVGQGQGNTRRGSSQRNMHKSSRGSSIEAASLAGSEAESQSVWYDRTAFFISIICTQPRGQWSLGLYMWLKYRYHRRH